MGTSIHAAAQMYFDESIKFQGKPLKTSMYVDKAMSVWLEEEDKVFYPPKQFAVGCRDKVMKGVKIFLEDIAPYIPTPVAVETKYHAKINHPIVEQIAGTIDILGEDYISDIKTSSRAIVPQSYSLQLGTYKWLCGVNGLKINNTNILGVNLSDTKATKDKPKGTINSMVTDDNQTKRVLKSILDKLEVYHKGIVEPEVLFNGNPTYYLCSRIWCSHHRDCSYVNQEALKQHDMFSVIQ